MGKGWANFERVVRLAPFTGPVRAMIHHLKYHKNWGLGEALADRLLEREGAKALLQETEVVVAVPLHWRRHLPRGYNQAEVIARRLAGRCGLKMARPVKRVRHTQTQTHQHSRAKREENLRGAFALRDGRAVVGKHVVIVDDVWTTGATMQAMARVLKGARPASISALVVATADPKGFERVEKPSTSSG
jgi:ComF family protein